MPVNASAPRRFEYAGRTGQPRVRGEHSTIRRDMLQSSGTRVSPACAGNTDPSMAVSFGVGVRVSPACAGNTTATHGLHGSSTGQPRVRGEHLWTILATLNTVGSAPRARGTPRELRAVPRNSYSTGQPRVRGETRLHARLQAGCARVSPACAGNTRTDWRIERTLTGQPRVRGEHPETLPIAGSTFGSAPRARGTPCPGR